MRQLKAFLENGYQTSSFSKYSLYSTNSGCCFLSIGERKMPFYAILSHSTKLWVLKKQPLFSKEGQLVELNGNSGAVYIRRNPSVRLRKNKKN